MRIEELTEQHLRSLKARDFEVSDLGDNFIKDKAPEYLASEYKKAVVSNDGEVILVFGGKLTGKHGAWVWLLGSDLISKNPIATMEMILMMHNEGMEICKAIGVRYFYTFNHPDFPFAIKFLKRLGYTERDSALFNDGIQRTILVREF